MAFLSMFPYIVSHTNLYIGFTTPFTCFGADTHCKPLESTQLEVKCCRVASHTRIPPAE
jgi:hypothetical protein